MKMPLNTLKEKLLSGENQYGCWLSLGNGAVAETCAWAGFDWLLIDTEHAPTELSEVHQLLQAIHGNSSQAIVRAYWNDTVFIKRLLDLGVQSLLIPYVESADEAKKAVAAVRYPPRGVRGVSGNSRANRYGRVENYFSRAEDQICLMVQVESVSALKKIREIGAVEGVDVIFIGPADLAADMGHLGNPRHPIVKKAMRKAIEDIRQTGKIAATLAFAPDDAREWSQQGAQLIAVASDMFLITRSANDLASTFCQKRGK